MYFPYFIAYIASGFVIGIAVFFWALKKGQFGEQDRARFLPLEDDADDAPAKATKFNRIEAYGLMVLAAAGLSATAAVLIYALATAP